MAAHLLDTQAFKRGDRNDALPYSARGGPARYDAGDLKYGKGGTHLHTQALYLRALKKNVSTYTAANTYIHHGARHVSMYSLHSLAVRIYLLWRIATERNLLLSGL